MYKWFPKNVFRDCHLDSLTYCSEMAESLLTIAYQVCWVKKQYAIIIWSRFCLVTSKLLVTNCSSASKIQPLLLSCSCLAESQNSCHLSFICQKKKPNFITHNNKGKHSLLEYSHQHHSFLPGHLCLPIPLPFLRGNRWKSLQILISMPAEHNSWFAHIKIDW